jgi:DNA polymerase III delta prime subunit
MKDIWLEKYRPKNFNDFYEQEETVQIIKDFIEKKDIPNMIFFGSPGTGKTSLAYIIINQLFTPDIKKERVLELNASDDRGIKIVRNIIKKFASYSISTQNDIIPIKIIFLDEADSLTLDSQFALRRIIEDYSKTTRFILTCNYLNKLIQPIISRCCLLKFHDFSNNGLNKILNNILEKEKIIHTIDKEKLIHTQTNVREIINILQSGNIDSISNFELEWNKLNKMSNQEVLKYFKELYMDGISFDIILKSMINNIINESKINNLNNRNFFFLELTQIITNITNKGTPLINTVYLFLLYKSLE